MNTSDSNPVIAGRPCWCASICEFCTDVAPYIYLLRVQLITLLMLVGFPILALWGAPTLLKGIFDVQWPEMILIALSAELTAWTVMVTMWQVFRYGVERFGIRPFPIRSGWFMDAPSHPSHWLTFGLFALPAIVVTMYVSQSGGTANYPHLAVGAAIGLALAIGLINCGGMADRLGWLEPPVLTRAISALGPGFKKNEVSAHSGHYVAFWSGLICFVTYGAIGISKFLRIGSAPHVPTLADIFVFAMILCWSLALITFVLDRFRVPLLLPLLIAVLIGSYVPLTDHYFFLKHVEGAPVVSPAAAIRSGKPGSTVIVVAASGGGIKAAAWTAQVLTGLETYSRQNFPANPRIFGDSVRLISSVSGGSVGTMYFANEYDPIAGGLPDTHYEDAVGQAELSSLDDIAWGMVYPDFLRLFLPIFPHYDRGTALERALTRGAREGSDEREGADGLSGPLSNWRLRALTGKMPAVVFNATVVESGERILLGTTDVTPANGRTSLQDPEYQQFTGDDVAVVTAARLSATFPYVSPAARPNITGPQIHIVDGGYTDNFGMATLLAWLDEALSAADNPVRRVLIIEIRASPTASGAPDVSSHGWPFQTYAPLDAMLNVRDRGQVARNQEECSLLRRLATASPNKIEVRDILFPYMPTDAPLSWHLSPNDKKEIATVWRAPVNDPKREAVRDFFNGTPASADALEYDVCQ